MVIDAENFKLKVLFERESIQFWLVSRTNTFQKYHFSYIHNANAPYFHHANDQCLYKQIPFTSS